MKNDENLNKQPHWRCRLCGHSTPLGQAVCSNPNCRADLGIYGEAVTPGQEDDVRRAWKQQEEDARRQREEEQWGKEEEQRRKEEAQRRKDEEQRQKAEEQARRKADRQAGQQGGGVPRWLIPALAAVLIAVLGIGVGVFFAGRSTAENPTPPRQSAGPGSSFSPTQTEKPGVLESDAPVPDESQPGQEESPASAPWKDNVLMADPNGKVHGEVSSQPCFGQRDRASIASVTFLDTVDAAKAQWDVSQAQDGSVWAWMDARSGGQYDLYIAGNGGVAAPEDCSGMFRGYTNAERITFNGAFHTENAVSMNHMFAECEALTSVDVDGFDTSNVTDLSYLFYCCETLAQVDVSGFDTSAATTMRSMFAFCHCLAAVDVSGFNTAGVESMAWMFANCNCLTTLDVSGFDTSRVTDMDSTFYSCESLKSLDVSGFDTSRVTDMGNLFSGCKSLTALDVSSFDTSRVTDMAGMFMHCFNLRSLDVSGLNTSSTITMYFMFCGCKSLTTLDVSSFDTSNVTKMAQMFSGCSGLAELDITNFKTGKVTDMTKMFSDIADDFVLHYSPENFDTSNVTEYDGFMPDSFDWKKLFQ